MTKRTVFLACTLFLFCVGSVHAATLLKYNFNQRVPDGTSQQIPYTWTGSTWGGNQDPYVPQAAVGEFGPTLTSSVPKYSAWLRMYLSNDTAGSEGRETLEYKSANGSYYKSPSGVLPATGSFTWELVGSVLGFDGVNHQGMLFDNTTGLYRMPNYGYDNTNSTTTSRLHLQPVDSERFRLLFCVPIDTRGRCGIVSTVLNYGDYHHIGAVYDDDAHMMYLYIDEKLVGSTAVTSIARGTGFGLGGYSPDVTGVTYGMYFKQGFFDWVSVSDGSLEPGWFQTTGAQVPEPATMSLLGCAACGIGAYLRRRRNG